MEATQETVEEVQNQEVDTTQSVEDTTTDTTTTNTTETTEATKGETQPVAPQQNIVSFEDGLKEFGLSKEELAEFKAQREAQKAEAEKPFNEQKEWAKALTFGIENKIISKEDVDKHTVLLAKADRDLVFEVFEKEFVSELEDATPEELADEKREAFNQVYNLESANPKAKAKGEALLKAEADKVRGEYADKFQKVNSEYQERMVAHNFKSDQQGILSELNKTGYTEKITVEGTEIEVEIPVTMTFEEAMTELISDKGQAALDIMHNLYKQDKEAGKQVFTEWVKSKNRDVAIAKAAYDAGREAQKAVSIGATAPFNSREATGSSTSTDSMTDILKKQKEAMGLNNPY